MANMGRCRTNTPGFLYWAKRFPDLDAPSDIRDNADTRISYFDLPTIWGPYKQLASVCVCTVKHPTVSLICVGTRLINR